MLQNSPEFQSAVAKLRLRWQKRDDESEQGLRDMVLAKEEVLTQYQHIFALDNIGQLSADIYKSFLLFRNNRHWSGLHRVGGKAAENMDRLHQALAILLDEHLSITDRLNQLLPKNAAPLVPYLGRAIITAILQIAYPEKYGVWNNVSESALKDLGLWPDFERGLPIGERYLLVNNVLLRLCEAVGVDLWTLDALFWGPLLDLDPVIGPERVAIEEIEAIQRFGLERHLHYFLYDNWDSIHNLAEWRLHEEAGDIVGFEYNTGEVGRIDLLARHRIENRWLVIELKRDQSSDQTVGQVLRYMGWVSEKLAEPGAVIEGLVISHTSDRTIEYALKHVPNVKQLVYEVKFSLKPI